MGKHGTPEKKAEQTAMVESIIETLKSEGVTRFGTTSYCWGGENACSTRTFFSVDLQFACYAARSAFNVAFKDITHVTVTAHPSAFQIPEDFEVSYS